MGLCSITSKGKSAKLVFRKADEKLLMENPYPDLLLLIWRLSGLRGVRYALSVALFGVFGFAFPVRVLPFPEVIPTY